MVSPTSTHKSRHSPQSNDALACYRFRVESDFHRLAVGRLEAYDSIHAYDAETPKVYQKVTLDLGTEIIHTRELLRDRFDCFRSPSSDPYISTLTGESPTHTRY